MYFLSFSRVKGMLDSCSSIKSISELKSSNFKSRDAGVDCHKVMKSKFIAWDDFFAFFAARLSQPTSINKSKPMHMYWTQTDDSDFENKDENKNEGKSDQGEGDNTTDEDSLDEELPCLEVATQEEDTNQLASPSRSELEADEDKAENNKDDNKQEVPLRGTMQTIVVENPNPKAPETFIKDKRRKRKRISAIEDDVELTKQKRS
jgi:hypothetical protein